MLNALTSLPSTGALEVLRIAAIWWLRSGLILLFALWVLRRSGKASAATRHALLAVALISSLALPGLSLVLPSWSLPIAPSWWPGGSVMSSPSARPIAPLGAESAFSFVSVEDPTVSATVIPTPEATDVESAASHRSDGQSGLTVAGPAESILATKGLVPVTVRSLSVLPSEPGFDWVPAVSLALLLLWGGGVALRCGGRLLSLKSRRRLRRTAQDAEPALVSVLDGVREELGIRRTVRLSMSSSIDIPITWGTWRPIVLLPAAANGWAPQRLQHILLHELSHVRRCDGLVQATVWLVVTLRWFDPLAWYAAARLRIEAERACDDNVLLAGGRPAVYAGHLLEIARAASFHGLGAAVAMAQTKSSLSSRVEAILDRGLVRHSTGVRRHSVIAVLGLALVAVVASAAVRPERPPKPPERPEPLGPVVLAPPVQPQTVASPAPAPPAPLTARPPVGASLSAVPVPEAHPGRGDSPRPGYSESPVPAVTEPVIASGAVPRPDPPSDVEPMLAPSLAPAVEPVPESDDRSRPRAPRSAPTPESPPVPAVAPVVAVGTSGTHRRTSYTADLDDDLGAWPYFAAAVDRGDCKPRLFAGGRLGVHTEVDESDWTVEMFHGACRLEVMVRGHVTFGDDDTTVSAVARGAKIEVTEETRSGNRKLVIVGGPGGGPSFDYRVDDSPQSAEVGRAWLAEVLPALYRRTDFRVEERTERILKRDGVQGVLAELHLLSTDYVVRAYVKALLERANLEPAQMEQLLDVVGSVSSDYELAEILVSLRAVDLASEGVRRKFVAVSRGIESDYELRRVMEHLLTRANLSAETQDALLGLAASVESDYELAEVLVAMLSSGSGTPNGHLGLPLFEAMKTIDSDYELRRVLDAAADLEVLDAADLIGLLEASMDVGSDYEQAEFLVHLARLHAMTGEVAEAYREALAGIGSSHESERARSALVARP